MLLVCSLCLATQWLFSGSSTKGLWLYCCMWRLVPVTFLVLLLCVHESVWEHVCLCVGVHLWGTGRRGIKRLHLTPLSNNFSVATTARREWEQALSFPDSLSFIPSHSLLPSASSFCSSFCCQRFKLSWITSPSPSCLILAHCPDYIFSLLYFCTDDCRKHKGCLLCHHFETLTLYIHCSR